MRYLRIGGAIAAAITAAGIAFAQQTPPSENKGVTSKPMGDGVAKEYKGGDRVLAYRNTTHWWQNKGSEPVAFLPVDIFKQ